MTARLRGIDFLANNAELAGGEVMLLCMAEAARELAIDVRVVGPTYAEGIEGAARAGGFPFLAIPGTDRRAYVIGLGRRLRSSPATLQWCNGLVPALGTRLSRSRRVVHLHQLPSPRQRRARRAALRRSDLLVAPSSSLATQLRSTGFPAPAVLENWTEERAVIPLRDPLTTPVRVGTMGRLSTDKGVDVLADAMAILAGRHPDRFSLTLAGDHRFVPPDDAARVRQALDRARVRTIELGWVDPASFFVAVDLVVVPSRWDEPFGLVAAQAMAAGRPLVVTGAGALPTIVGPDHPWVVPRDDPAALADAIEHAANDPDAPAVVERQRTRWNERYAPAAGRVRFAALVRERWPELLTPAPR